MADEILTKEPVVIGEKVIDLICVAWASRKPIILRGTHGLGKSEIVEQAAKTLEIEYRCMDLSIMEPPDLLGMPKIDGENLRYYPPATLPKKKFKKVKGKSGRLKEDENNEGLLCFEELNRCDDAMQAPCLQLLTARKLNEYELPVGWCIVACINPSGDIYNVNDLDPALLNRFMVIDICAGKKEWLKWANKNKVHEAIVSVVSEHPDPFDTKTGVPPRTWKYVSDILNSFNEYEGLNEEVLKDAIQGYLNSEWTNAVIDTLVDMGEYDKKVLKVDDSDEEVIDPQSLKAADKLPDIKTLVSKYTATYRARVKKMSRQVLNANAELLANTFNNKINTKDALVFCDHILRPRHLMNLNRLFADLNNDARKVFMNSLNSSLRDSFGTHTDSTGQIIKGIKITDSEKLRLNLGGHIKFKTKRTRKVKKNWNPPPRL